MGIEIKYPVRALSDTAFKQLDYRVMSRAFSIHNEMGTLWDEIDYKGALLFFLGISPDDPLKRFVAISPESLIHVSGLTRNKPSCCKNLQKYLNASSAQYLDWINFDQNQIEIYTLNKIILP
jgi:hypothetical protein